MDSDGGGGESGRAESSLPSNRNRSYSDFENSSSSVSNSNRHERGSTNSTKNGESYRRIESLSEVDSTPGGGAVVFDDGDERTGRVENLEMIEDEAVKRLSELRSSGEEPELSDQLIRINKELQQDELVALEAIYGDSISILHNQNGLKCFQVNIHVQVPCEFLVTAANFKSNSNCNGEDNSPDMSHSFRVSHLPPVILACLLPESYPSLCPPYFTISVKWLSSDKISELCGKLDSIWGEQAGQEVLYQWVEWLQSSSLSFLGFDNEIVFYSSYIRGGVEDRRVISYGVSPDIGMALLKNYDEECCHEDFCRSLQECCICFSVLPGSGFVRLPCQHFFCEKCLKTFSKMHLKEGSVMKLKCPEAKCDGMIPPGSLKRLLGSTEFELLDALLLQRTLETMNDVVFCPRCEMACLKDEDNHAQCSKCFYSFCTFCLDRRHVGVSCMTPEMKLVILQERQNSTTLGGKQRLREKDIINQLLSVAEINRFANRCPLCKVPVYRDGGCNKMTCRNCGGYFCYRCNRPISGYDHFRDGNCELFPRDEIRRWEAQNAPRAVAEFRARLGSRCPNCGQHNAKEANNNHILCRGCRVHYCYLCKEMVRHCSEHYGPKGCKQHTPG